MIERNLIQIAVCLAAFAMSAMAQTTVTTSGTTTSGTVPVFNGTATVTNSPISVSGGNVGIGTPNPTVALSVSGQLASTYYGSATAANTSVITMNGSQTVANTGGFYGLNASPAYVGSGTLANLLGISINPLVYTSTGTVTNAFGAYFRVDNGTAGGTITNLYGNYIAAGSNSGTITNKYALVTEPNAGYVGIGTTNPQKKLHIAGDVEIDGNLYFGSNGTAQSVAYSGNCGADYAESVDVTGDRAKYAPGDVLVIDPKTPGQFLKSNEPYSTMAAGIYSTKPGYVGRLREANDPASSNEIPMAMLGRVPTKVTAENGPIQVGDLLVTSSTLGYAMKGTDRSRLTGAVIGKALGSLDSGTGTIMVLVTLQ